MGRRPRSDAEAAAFSAPASSTEVLRRGRKHAGLSIRSFRTGKALKAWLQAQTADAPGIWIKLQKRQAGRSSMLRQDVVDAALCHGWIDGQVLSWGEAAYLIRLTPRRARSLWSQVNRERALVLMEERRMTEQGLARIQEPIADGRWTRAYASSRSIQTPADLKDALDGDTRAKQAFAALSKTERYTILHRLETAKKIETRERIIHALLLRLA